MQKFSTATILIIIIISTYFLIGCSTTSHQPDHYSRIGMPPVLVQRQGQIIDIDQINEYNKDSYKWQKPWWKRGVWHEYNKDKPYGHTQTWPFQYKGISRLDL